MKKFTTLLFVSMLGGILTLGSYKIFLEEDIFNLDEVQQTTVQNPSAGILQVSYESKFYGTNADFTEAAEKTVHGVVHVKNVAVFGPSKSVWEHQYRGEGGGKALRGAGSGVIITPDGYIVTNNHVINGANEIEVTLNNNKTYKAEVIGTEPSADIALIKIDAENLDYLPFGNSNNIRLGEWVLAVGNPFNLTSTVTAGIVSAKARDINAYDGTPQSFIQTDAAINPGNSGGALVNINGELIGINTAITSQTGSYIGYGFAVPSNNARKIVEDILEYGNVQRGILGIRGQDVNQGISRKLDLPVAQGVLVGDVDSESGAAVAGIRQGDVIRQIDNIEVRKMSDLTGYIGSKRPDDVVKVTVIREGRERNLEVKLTKYETYAITPIGLEVTNASKEDLQRFKTTNGVKISGALTGDEQSQALIGIIITKLDNQKVNDISDVKKILNSKNPKEPLSVTFVNSKGEEQTYIWRQ
ncbi:trypsin-like peptidase domain-containing protein [Antarcticibacterium sp. 1MA-6-2]|uniref:trypsin-like peptidase domain-containing protein n=1 Tax=Antarcticibacterium sp. 1MA-6-2 TaxID=2908210 RepID=UPI001F1DF75D|nr:trypsin-like peptidase domain-containing protein [Antarcticibacterium sp. 1MA-6-2]UJH91173.1 trypsin-like peptidase domain-containing protein [Antarcticibacterium sp. 1MA-6-2]